MSLKEKLTSTLVSGAGAVLCKPLGNLALSFIPGLKEFIGVTLENPEIKELIKKTVESLIDASSGVSTEFLAANLKKFINSVGTKPKLTEAYHIALQQAFKNIQEKLSKEQKEKNILPATLNLNSNDQFFIDWLEKLKELQTSISENENAVEYEQFEQILFASADIETDEKWWTEVKALLESWSKTNIPDDLSDYLKQNLIKFIQEALTKTLQRETYAGVWQEYQKVIQTQSLALLKDFEKHILALEEMSKVAGGRFLQNGEEINFSLRKPIENLVEKLSTKEIYIEREATINRENRIKGLSDLEKKDGYFLLAASAGSGKSTLLAHWIREFASSNQIQNQTPVKICYHFYSKQEGTKDYDKGLTILSDQLLKAHHIQANVNSFNPATVSSIIPYALELNHPTRLLVIIDGLDEAGDPATEADFLSLFKPLFPRNLGENTTVILTVRNDQGMRSFQHYQEELGIPLQELILPDVNNAALTSYLLKSADERLRRKANDQNFKERIIEKTEGLAIYVHYLLDELSKANEIHWTERIKELPKGFEEYVKASLPVALTGKPNWEDALSFIALTQAPLDKHDLVALTKLSGNKLDNIDFDNVRWDIKRWLRNEADSWAFSHQKIGEVFYKRYVADRKAIFIKHLLNYCEEWEQHKSAYALLNYAKLLRTDGKEEKLYRLADNENFLATQRNVLTDTPDASLRTLQTAILYAAEKNNGAMMAKFSLSHALLVEKLSEEPWLEAFAHRGFSGALQLADHFGDDERRVVWYLLTAWKLAKSNEKEEAEKILRRIDALPLTELSGSQSLIAEFVLPIFLEVAHLNLILNIYAKILVKSKFERKVFNISKQFLQIGDFDKAEQCIRSINDSQLRLTALISLAINLADVNRRERAEHIIDEVKPIAYSDKNLSFRASILANLAILLLRIDRISEAEQIIDEIIQIANSSKTILTKFYIFKYLSSILFKAHLFDKANQIFYEAEKIADSIEDKNVRQEKLKKLAEILIDARFLDRAEHIVHSMENAFIRSQLLAKLAVASIHEQFADKSQRLFAEAEQIARSIEDTRESFEILTSLTQSAFDAGFINKSHELFKEAEQVAYSTEDFRIRYQFIKTIFTLSLYMERFDKTENSLNKIEQFIYSNEKPVDYSQFIDHLALSLAESHQFDKARQVVFFIRNSRIRSQTLANFALVLTHKEFTVESRQLFTEAEQIARSIEKSEDKNEALAVIALKLAEAKQFTESERVAHSIKDSRLRSKSLRNLAVELAKSLSFEQAERVARSIKTSISRSQSLAKLGAALHDAQLLNKARQIFEEAKQIANSIREIRQKSLALIQIAIELKDSKSFDELEQSARSIEDITYRSMVLRNLAQALARVSSFEKSKRVALSIESVGYRLQALAGLAEALAKDHLFEDALIITKKLRWKDCLNVLDEFTKAKRPELLKNYIVPLSYKMDSALLACAHIILLYENQLDKIFAEIYRYLSQQTTKAK
ncbi:MAG TPA: NACHT domain-containing protein [Pyrinomonadaceae bacterium]|jgi:hypothetical protein